MSRLACDTSVLVPALLSWHPDHERARDAVRGVTVVPSHVLFECYSVLTRLPAPHRVAGKDAAAAVGALPWSAVTLPARNQIRVIALIGAAGVTGGAAYDALVAATAVHHELVLLTRDRRARTTYELVGVQYHLV